MATPVGCNAYHRAARTHRLLLALLAAALAGCSSGPPPRLFLLGPAATGTTRQQAELASLPSRDVSLEGRGTIAAIVTVIVPQYLQRPEIMVRTDAHEMRALENARWAEDLPITASRALGNDLDALLPGYDIVAWPSKLDQSAGKQITVDLSRYEADSNGMIEIAGRWVIIDNASDKPEASGHFRHAAQASNLEPGAIAVAMSGLLTSVGSDMVPALEKLQSSGTGLPRRGSRNRAGAMERTQAPASPNSQ